MRNKILNHSETNNSGMHCNWKKTKLQNIGSGPPPLRAQVNGQMIEYVIKFTYLGSDITSDGWSRQMCLSESDSLAA